MISTISFVADGSTQPTSHRRRVAPFDAGPMRDRPTHADDVTGRAATPAGPSSSSEARPAAADTAELLARHAARTPDTTQVAVEDAGMQPHAITLQQRVDGALLDAVDVPWTLTASGHLAQVSGLLRASAPTMVPASGAQAARTVAAGAEAPSGMARVMGETTEPPANSLEAPRVIDEAPHRAPSPFRAAVEEGVRAAASQALTAPWSRQLLRAIERDGDIVLYVRDFRLDDTLAHQLASSLRNACRDDARALRIVVNGRTLYDDGDATRHAR